MIEQKLLQSADFQSHVKRAGKAIIELCGQELECGCDIRAIVVALAFATKTYMEEAEKYEQMVSNNARN